MRTLVVSDRSRALLEGSIVGCAVGFGRQLADKSWEVSVDDDMGFALDCLSWDPDQAIEMVCTADWQWCPLCERRGPTIDDGETCARCKLVLP